VRTDTVDIAIAWRGDTLAGTLHVPRGADDETPVVVMVQGSGPSDRDAEGYFPAVRVAFLDRGIATFSFDKPGCGDSTGDWCDHALGHRADQVLSTLDVLAGRHDIDARRLGVWGHSQGGWVTQIVAAQRPDLAFAISNSGPSIPVRAQDEYGLEHSMRAAGRPEAEIDDALAFLRELHEAAARRDSHDALERSLLVRVRNAPWAEHVPFGNAAEWRLLTAFVAEAYDPVPTLRRVRCPYLAVFGGQDVLVPPWSGAEETGVALGDCPDATIVVYPHGDHRIQVGGPLAFAPGYLDLLGDWAASRIRQASSTNSRTL
jgi:uncharacterized protein